MTKIMSAKEAVELIKDGDVIGLSSFVGIAIPEAVHDAITERYRQTGSPRELTIVSSAGSGAFDENRAAEPYIKEGAVKKLVLGHSGSMLNTKKMMANGEIEAYNIPLGAMAHTIRTMASGMPGHLDKLGLGLFVDPRIEGPGLNHISKDDSMVKVVEVDGEEFLYYKLPRFNVAIMKASSVDINGNISYENEPVIIDPLPMAQLTKANGGKVIIQVDRVLDKAIEPRDVVVPDILIDAVVVAEPVVVPEGAAVKRDNTVADIIGKRASKELKKGDIVNIGIGIPESVSKFAKADGILDDIVMTVESGGIGGVPASGLMFGSMLQPKMLYSMCSQFDFYDGGGLDICFMGGLEADRYGNVNAHRAEGAISGIGGFGNITSATKNVVFCLTFNAKGLKVKNEGGVVTVLQEGSIPKFGEKVRSVSFSGARAFERGQKVLYVTERCVFQLCKEGLMLTEVYPGIDMQKDVLDRLDFPVKLADNLKK